MSEPAFHTVFTGSDVDAAIFLEDAVTGLPSGIASVGRWQPGMDSPLLSYCFIESIVITANLETTLRPATGDPFKRHVPQQYGYTATVNNLYFLTSELDRTALFNRQSLLRIYILQKNLFKEVQQILIHTLATAFSISTSGNSEDQGAQTTKANATFSSEEYASYP